MDKGEKRRIFEAARRVSWGVENGEVTIIIRAGKVVQVRPMEAILADEFKDITAN